MVLWQCHLPCFPSRRDPAPAELGLHGVPREIVPTADGESLVLWFAPPASGRPMILFLHGNAGSVADRAGRMAFYQSRSFGATFLSWRGHGGSNGRPTEAAWRFLAGAGVPPGRIGVMGEFLGTEVAALVPEAPFTAAVDLATRAYPWLPVRLLMRDQFRSRSRIGAVRAPLFILHGEVDTVIPFAFGQDPFALANTPETVVSLGPVGHEALAIPRLGARAPISSQRQSRLDPGPGAAHLCSAAPDEAPMTDAPFRPFDTHLDEAAALATLRTATDGADDGELFLERRRAEALVLDDGRIRQATYDASQGFGLRAVRGEVAGYAHSTEITETALRRASETARLAVGAGGGTLAPGPRGTNTRLYRPDDPMADAAFPVKIDLLREIDAHARALDPRVVQVSATLSASLQEVEILRPDGLRLADVRPMARLNVSVMIEEGGRREQGGSGIGGRHGLARLMAPATWKVQIAEALRIAQVNLGAVEAPAGVMDVVLGPGWPGILLHEAIGHGLEGDFNRKETSAFAGLMGKQIASKGVTVLDDGTIPDRRGSLSIDDEGTPSARNVLIEDGVLVGYMQDRQNARLMGVAPTGNGRRESFAHIPMPRMTNTYMLSGPDDPAGIVASLKDGIYAVGFGGGQVDITSGKFVFSCTEAYRVKNGVIGAAVKGATLIGDGATALKGIRAIGNDLQLDPGIGNCGKAGQWVPVGVGQPTLLIGGLTVGGAAA